MLVLFVPIVQIPGHWRFVSLRVPFAVLLYSVVVFIVIPLARGHALRRVCSSGRTARNGLRKRFCRVSPR